MRRKNSHILLATVLMLLFGLVMTSSDALAANGGTISAYFGTDTTTTISGDKNTATASGNGTGGLAGGAVKYNGNNLTNGTTPGWSTSSDQSSKDIVITPASGYQIVWVKTWRPGQSWVDETVDSPATGATTYQVKIKSGRGYKIAVLFEPVAVNYNVSYTVAADNPAGTNCDTTKTVTPTSPQSVTANSNPTFTITNTNAACQVDSVNFDNTGWSTAGIVGNVYTTPDITKNVSFQIRYRGHSYTITSSVDATGATGCGSISPGTQSYAAASNQMFSIVKNFGCAIDSVLVDGSTDVTNAVTAASNTYTFSNIQANHTIAVKFVTTVTAPGQNYCQVPPFMSGVTALKPNVLVLFDNSGSMGENPYSGKTYDCTETGTKSNLDNCTNYYGYFDKGTMYQLKTGSTTDYNLNTGATLNLSPKTGTGNNKGLSGNYLNYVNMRKVDIIRKILVGGQVDSSVGSARGTATGPTHTRWLITDSNKRVEYGTSDPTGIVQTVYDQVRFGLMVFNDNSGDKGSDDGGYIAARFGTSKADLIAAIESNATDPGGSTPLAESLYEAMRYFRGTTSAYNSGVDYGNTTDYPIDSPFSRHAIQASCQKHFVLVITDGEPTNDGNIPSNGSSTNITDTSFSNWWTSSSANAGTLGLSSSNLMGRVAYYAHTHDMLDLTKTPTDISSINNLSIYTIFTFDSSATGVSTLQQAAKFGSFVETSSAHNAKPDISTEWSSDGGTTYNNYYQAQAGDVLQSNIEASLGNMIATTASGTAAAVANNKSGERGANMIQALFYPQWTSDPKIKWLGEVQALWYYLDPVINFSGIYEDSTVDKILDLNSDGMPPIDPFDTKSLWRAGKQLQLTASADRKIYTLLDSSASLTSSNNTFTTSVLTTTSPTLKSLMNVGTLTDTQAGVLVNYLRGDDNSMYRPRTVKFVDPSYPSGTSEADRTSTGVWKLGDIINSTPQVQSSVALNAYQNAYNDLTYDAFVKTAAYKSRNVVYTGSNDGMFHAFKLGTVNKLSDSSQPFKIAEMVNSDTRSPNPAIGSEEWAYIPQNALPYLQNQAGTNYCHQNLVDGAPLVVDASINNYTNCKMPDGTTTATDYWDCERKLASWKTVVVSSMGLGGASRDAGGSCNETYSPDTNPANNTDCVKSPVAGSGLSSYFALDVSDPITPKFMWEFSDTKIAAAADKGLGFTTPGPAIIRVNATDTGGRPNKAKNGRWFAVFASGPTGAINTSNLSFSGHSDQNLKIYIVDLNGGSTFTKCSSAGATGCNYWVKDTNIPFAFANSLNGAAIDLDRWNSNKNGNYSDDVVYITYTKASLTHNAASPSGDFPSSATAWDKGGIIRLVTNHNPDPATWFLSSLIDDIGPVTTSVGRLQDRANKKLWVYFGEGRYFFPGDEMNTGRRFFGISDPCYNQYLDTTSTYTQYSGDDFTNYALGTAAARCPAVTVSDLQLQDTPSPSLDVGKKGWYVNMAAQSGAIGAERVVSDVAAAFNGTIFYTTFIPNLTDVCQPGGSTSMWAVKYDTGGTPSSGALVGKAPVQTSSGGVKLIDLSTSFTAPGSYGRKLNAAISPMGMAPKGKFPPLLSPRAVKHILNIQEQ